MTSAAHVYRTGKLLVFGYVRHGTLLMGAACRMKAFGVERRATRHDPNAYDPGNARLRG